MGPMSLRQPISPAAKSLWNSALPPLQGQEQSPGRAFLFPSIKFLGGVGDFFQEVPRALPLHLTKRLQNLESHATAFFGVELAAKDVCAADGGG